MARVRQFVAGGLCALLLLTSAGCGELWHNLQPHRLHRLNRGGGMTEGSEAYYSVPAADESEESRDR